MQMAIEVPTRRRFSVEEYFKLFEIGVLGSDERVELIEGEILVMTTPGPAHSAIVMRLNKFLVTRLPDQALVRIDSASVLSEDSAPRPDIAVICMRDDFYEVADPRPNDILALVEVADSSLRLDRGRKLGLYARTGITEYWIVNVAAKTIERCRHPDGEGYAERLVFTNGERIAFAAFPETVFEVDDLVGPKRA